MKRFLTALLVLLLLLSAFACRTESKAPEAAIEPTEAPTQEPTPEPTAEPKESVLERHGWTADFFGEGEPDPALGSDGDTYVDVAGHGYYVRENGAWSLAVTLRDADCSLVRFFDPSGTELKPQIVRTGEPAAEPAFDTNGRELLGWFSDGYAAAWAFDAPVESDMTLSAICVDTLEKNPTRYTEADRFDYYLRAGEAVGVAVLFLGFTDGLALDKATFEDRFTGEYGLDECLNSVASYYKYNSYGKAQLEFHFFYYDTGMTSKEAYDLVQKRGSDLFYRAIDAFRKEQPDAIRACDKNGDGWIDLTIVIGGEDVKKTVGDGNEYYLYGGSQGFEQKTPNAKLPTVNNCLMMPYDRLREPVSHADQGTGTRVLLHEIGHAFGLLDYYDRMPAEGAEIIDTLGGYDMQSSDVGDWNPYSKFSVGWLDPYVITPEIDRVTVKLGCSSETPDAILIPTSKGWNGTPFDEYILIDVMAPKGANAFDWNWATDARLVRADDPNTDGGVRIYHVDARLLNVDGSGAAAKYAPLGDAELLSFLSGAEPERWKFHSLWHRFPNSNGFEPYLAEDPPTYHQIDLIPSDGSSKFRLSTPTGWAVYTPFGVCDLFAPGSVFSTETCADAFANAPHTNGGGTLDYQVTVEHYDRTTHEAIVTIERIG